MKSHFPSQWYWLTQQGVSLSELQEHELMATDYMNMFTGIVGNFWNPNAPQNLRDTVIKAMSYTGLGLTTAWKLLPSQGVDTCKYLNIFNTAKYSLIGSYNVGACPAFTTHYADSLNLRPNCN